jgi:hypothetical protein
MHGHAGPPALLPQLQPHHGGRKLYVRPSSRFSTSPVSSHLLGLYLTAAADTILQLQQECTNGTLSSGGNVKLTTSGASALRLSAPVVRLAPLAIGLTAGLFAVLLGV